MSELLKAILGDELVTMKDGEVTTDSRKIAEVFGKEHYNVLADIEKLKKDMSKIAALKFEGVENINNCMEKSNALKFQGVEYKDKKGESRPMYILNRKSTMLLLMRYTGKEAFRIQFLYVEAFDAMESKLKEIAEIEYNELVENIRQEKNSVIYKCDKILAERQVAFNRNCTRLKKEAEFAVVEKGIAEAERDYFFDQLELTKENYDVKGVADYINSAAGIKRKRCTQEEVVKMLFDIKYVYYKNGELVAHSNAVNNGYVVSGGFGVRVTHMGMRNLWKKFVNQYRLAA